MGGAEDLGRFIDRLRGIRSAFASGRAGFLQEAEAEYRMICSRLVVEVLMMLRPPERDPDEWARQLEIMAAMVSSEVYSRDEVKLCIWLAHREQGQLGAEITGPDPGIFGKDTVLEWVQAGLDGNPDGKEIDERDRGDSASTIANRVWWSMYQGRSVNSADAIRRYLDAETCKHLEGDLPSVLKAWELTIRAIVRIDWREWALGVIRGDPF